MSATEKLQSVYVQVHYISYLEMQKIWEVSFLLLVVPAFPRCYVAENNVLWSKIDESQQIEWLGISGLFKVIRVNFHF